MPVMISVLPAASVYLDFKFSAYFVHFYSTISKCIDHTYFFFGRVFWSITHYVTYTVYNCHMKTSLNFWYYVMSSKILSTSRPSLMKFHSRALCTVKVNRVPLILEKLQGQRFQQCWLSNLFLQELSCPLHSSLEPFRLLALEVLRSMFTSFLLAFTIFVTTHGP